MKETFTASCIAEAVGRVRRVLTQALLRGRVIVALRDALTVTPCGLLAHGVVDALVGEVVAMRASLALRVEQRHAVERLS